ncbi:MAG: glycoside hydrolase family 16 protein, partial [Sulfitobacter sp.]|nr:glycoside hydrolase family 16 protein [Sulfitobacter sp.]
GTITLTGVGAHLGLAKVINGAEISNTGDAPASITYPVVLSDNNNTMTVDIDFGGGYWHFVLTKAQEALPIDGVWKMAPQAGALAVGPALGDFGWWASTADDVTTRACLFDDQFVFNADGTFSNVQDSETWLEAWQGTDPESCGTPVAPHDGSNAATWAYDEAAGTITLTGVGAHLGLAKVINGAEISNTGDAPASITYPVVLSDNNNTMT